MTSFRRTSTIPKLTCVPGNGFNNVYDAINACCQFAPSVVKCKNNGFDDVGMLTWECYAELSDWFLLSHTVVTCEGYNNPDDLYILYGSCGLKYQLDLTPKGRLHFNKANITIHPQLIIHHNQYKLFDTKYNIINGVLSLLLDFIGFSVAIAIMFWCCRKYFLYTNNEHLQCNDDKVSGSDDEVSGSDDEVSDLDDESIVEQNTGMSGLTKYYEILDLFIELNKNRNIIKILKSIIDKKQNKFNGEISNCGVSNVKDMSDMFNGEMFYQIQKKSNRTRSSSVPADFSYFACAESAASFSHSASFIQPIYVPDPVHVFAYVRTIPRPDIIYAYNTIPD
jgi:hypothetical protein